MTFASIIIQLMGTVYSPIAQLQRQGQEGRAKLNQWTRYLTIGIAALQALGVATWLGGQSTSTGLGLVVPGMSKFGFALMAVLTLTTGTMFIMWLGERITAQGIGDAFHDPSRERTVHVDRFSGEVRSQYGFDDYPLAAKAVAQGIGFHEGRSLGLVTFWFAFLFCVAVLYLMLDSGAVSREPVRLDPGSELLERDLGPCRAARN